jgi:ankyrin repeat protein
MKVAYLSIRKKGVVLSKVSMIFLLALSTTLCQASSSVDSDVNSYISQGGWLKTALYIAVESGNKEEVEALLHRGAKISVGCKRGPSRTPMIGYEQSSIQYAVNNFIASPDFSQRKVFADIIETFLKHDALALNTIVLSPLIQSYPKLVIAFLGRFGPNISNVRVKVLTLRTLLRYASADMIRHPVVTALIKNPAIASDILADVINAHTVSREVKMTVLQGADDVNKDNGTETPLMAACKKGDRGMLSELVNKGALLNGLINTGESLYSFALRYAEEYFLEEIMSLIGSCSELWIDSRAC